MTEEEEADLQAEAVATAAAYRASMDVVGNQPNTRRADCRQDADGAFTQVFDSPNVLVPLVEAFEHVCALDPTNAAAIRAAIGRVVLVMVPGQSSLTSSFSFFFFCKQMMYLEPGGVVTPAA